MNARILGLLAVLSVASGCVVHHHDNNYYANPGDVTLTWTFGGHTCQQTPDVASVTVDIPGQVLQPNTFACLTNGYPGITLTNFAPGSYQFTVTAYDSQGTPLYTQSGTFAVDGNVTVPADLQPTGNANSYAYVSWAFAAPSRNPQSAPTCGNSSGGDIPAVRLNIDGTVSYYNCTDGLGAAAVQTGYLASGQHSIEIAAVLPGATPASDYVFAVASSTLNTIAGSPNAQSFTMSWVVGGTAVSWRFNNGAPDCTSAGVSYIRVNFYDQATGTYLYPDGDTFGCSNGSNVALYNALVPGQFQVTVDALSSSGSVVYANASPLPVATIQAGAFASVSDAIPTTLY